MFATFYCCRFSPPNLNSKNIATYNLIIVVIVVVFPSCTIFIGPALFLLHNPRVTIFKCINRHFLQLFLRFALPHRGRMVKTRTRRETDKLELMRSQVFKICLSLSIKLSVCVPVLPLVTKCRRRTPSEARH